VDTSSKLGSLCEQELIAMPAITVDDTLVLPRIPRPDPALSRPRPVAQVITAHRQAEGAGFSVRRPFPGGLSMVESDPFLLLDHVGPQLNAAGEARGAPWHPHRGFETVSYILDGEIAHHDTNGGGGVIGEGDTQWMTAGGGILHDELPTEQVYRAGGPSHAVQLWVNLPPALKMASPRYQSITRDALRLLTSDDGGALIRLIAGDLAGHTGPGVTHTPITYAHATLAPGAQVSVAWDRAFSAFAYVLTGGGTAGSEARPIESGQLVVFGPGDHVVVAAADRQAEPLDVLLLGGLPIGAPIAHYGPFVMNSRDEIVQAIEDYQAGRLGIIPADQLAPRNFA
jgi:redox-sensitive bicupin YhaK (pirin superfamily)